MEDVILDISLANSNADFVLLNFGGIRSGLPSGEITIETAYKIMPFENTSSKESMEKALEHLKKQFVNIRAGKASPSMLGSVTVDYYGTQTPLSQVANVNTPDGRTITVL